MFPIEKLGWAPVIEKTVGVIGEGERERGQCMCRWKGMGRVVKGRSMLVKEEEGTRGGECIFEWKKRSGRDRGMAMLKIGRGVGRREWLS